LRQPPPRRFTPLLRRIYADDYDASAIFILPLLYYAAIT